MNDNTASSAIAALGEIVVATRDTNEACQAVKK